MEFFFQWFDKIVSCVFLIIYFVSEPIGIYCCTITSMQVKMLQHALNTSTSILFHHLTDLGSVVMNNGACKVI